MKFITITPTKFMNDALLTSDTTLVLAHLILIDEAYRKKCEEFKGKLVADNSFYELRRNLTISEMVEVFESVKPHTLVLPDLKYSKNVKTELLNIIKELRKQGVTCNFMGVVTVSDNFDDELKLFKILNDMDDIDIIAVPYSFRKEDEFRRSAFLDMVEKEIPLDKIKPVHLFGCNSIENITLEKRKYVVSIDGTMPWKCGFFNIKLPVSIEKEPKRPSTYFSISQISKRQQENIIFNLKYLKRLCEK